MNTPDSIVVRNLVKTFRSSGQPEVRAVDGLTFSVRRGSIFGLLGPNGAGKTTTLKMLTTLLRPTSGDIAVEGFDPAKDPLDVRKRISVVIQESAADLFLSVSDNFATFGRFHGLSHKAIHDRTQDVLDQFTVARQRGQHLARELRRFLEVARGPIGLRATDRMPLRLEAHTIQNVLITGRGKRLIVAY